jgi:O-antigen biosynthesis protein
VLGMHRGGTSALTGMVRLLGFDVGPDAELMAPTADNPRGFWELDRLSTFNERLLIELGARWSAPPPPDPQALAALATGPWGQRARQLFSELLGDGEWVWKDPRVCVLLPFWRAVLADVPGGGDDLVVVATVRNPREVAASLEARDELPVTYGLALWERHQRQAMVDSEGLPVYVVPYDTVLAQPAEACDRVAAFLERHGHRCDLDGARVAVGDFLDATQRHHHVAGALDDVAEATPAQRELAIMALERTGDQTGRWHRDLPTESPGLQLAFDGTARMARWQDRALQLGDGLAEHQADIRKLQRWLDESRADAAHAWGEVRRLEAQVAQTAIRLEDMTEGRDALVRALEEIIEERDGWKWEVLQQRNRGMARLRTVVRRGLVGES